VAVLDPESNDLVVRVVYDGPPEAGKTTSVRALAGSLGRPMYTPGQVDGRTVYFDWLDYTGGLFEGHRIRCQVVSVPGQATLAPRRRALLSTADVVVFVADSRRHELQSLPGYLQGLSALLAGSAGPPVGLLVQANKRDLPGAVPVAEVRGLLDRLALPVGIVESIAISGTGIRETFVFAVRLALDRVRELLRSGLLPSARPEVQSGEDLLAELRRSENGALDLATGDLPQHTRLREVRSPAGEALGEAVTADQVPPPMIGRVWQPPSASDPPPRAPEASVPGGLIWPPVNGRLMLHETGAQPVALERTAAGDWWGLAGSRWQVHSHAHAGFADLDRGRTALVEWARIHSASAAVLSAERCIVLADDARGGWRLWQLVRAEETLQQRLEAAAGLPPREAARSLVECVQAFLEAAARLAAAACRLPLTLATLRAARGGPPFVGLMPTPAFVRPPEPFPQAEVDGALLRELRPHLEALSARRLEIVAALDALPAADAAGPALARLRPLLSAS
jgi:signal recognition particle receptor subunit beta